MILQLHDRQLVGRSLIKPTLGHCDWLAVCSDLYLQCVAMAIDDAMTQLRWPWCQLAKIHSASDGESALIDLFDIFVHIVHNARFRRCFDTDSTLYTLLISYVNSSFMLRIDTSL